MIRVFGYLVWRSTCNRIARQMRRLRTPRYLIALLLGLAYLLVVASQQTSASGPPAGLAPETLELLAACGVVLVVAWSWIFADERRVLAFSPAEVTFLFPAPVTRRELIQFKLLRTQLVVLLNVILWTLLLSGERFGTSAWVRALSVWVLLTTLAFHRLGASFVRTSVAEHGRHGAGRRLVALSVAGLVLAALAWTVADALPSLLAARGRGLSTWLATLEEVASRPVPSLLLLPFRIAVAPLLAPSESAWVGSLGPALALLGGHYVWVIRSDAAFEEAAAATSLERVRRKQQRQRGGVGVTVVRPRWVPQLMPTGWPAGALLWKNLVALARTPRTRGTVVAFAAAGAAIAVLGVVGATWLAEIVGWLAMMWAGFSFLLGPQWIRNDLRGDLLQLDLLRSFPLPGRSVIAAETASSALVLTAVQLGLLLLAGAALSISGSLAPEVGGAPISLLAVVLCLPLVNFVAMLIHNGAAILLPAWTHPGPSRPTGVEALGQNMLLMVGFLLVLGLVLLPAAALAAGAFLFFEPDIGRWGAIPALAAGLGAATLEARFLVEQLGRTFEQTDPAAASPAA